MSIKNKAWVHGVHAIDKQTGDDCIIANIKDVETGESELIQITNPRRSVYITKKQFRNHRYKKEYAPKSELDEYKVCNKDMYDVIKRQLGHGPRSFVKQRDLINNPYVYGVDIPMVTLAKQFYKRNGSQKGFSVKRGALDLETSVLGGREIIYFAYVDNDYNVYLAAYKPFFKNGQSIADIEPIFRDIIGQWRDTLNDDAKEIFDKVNVKTHYFETNDELELIKWSMNNIHAAKDDFVGIWNMNFDAPYILDRLRVLGANPYAIMAHPEVDYRFRVCRYKEDKAKVAHFTDSWHWFFLSGYTQWYDQQNLYSRMRKVKGREPKYTLKAIGDKILGTGKLDIAEDGHREMQLNRFVEYGVYAIVDVLTPKLMADLTEDIDNCMVLCEMSDLSDYNKQTTMVRDTFRDYCENHDMVPASCRGSQATESDELIHNVGGGVLSPLLAYGTGTAILKDCEQETKLHKLVLDLDVKAMYPSEMIAFNISKETKLATCLEIVGYPFEAINELFALVTAPVENAIEICSTFFNLPTFEEMLDLVDAEAAMA